MKILSSVILSLIFLVFWSCSDSGEPKLEGCTDSGACNYSAENTHNDDSCWTPTEGCSCSEAAGAVVDECGVCGGSGPIDVNHDCGGTCIVSTDICGTCGGTVVNSADCCPEGQVPDCAGECGGTAAIDCNGDCGGSAVKDCAGTCGGTAENDDCGVCSGDNSSCVNYSTEIQPIFNTNCTACHITSTRNNLSLSNYANIMSGDSNNGPVIDDTGDHTISLLWQYVNSGYMPLGNSNLTASQINLIATWINEGALDN